MQTFLFMATLAQSLIHWIYHKPTLKWLPGSLCPFNSFRKVSFALKRILKNQLHNYFPYIKALRQYLVFTG